MDAQTQRTLGDLNRDFYELHANSFEAKRERPSQGWSRVLDACLRSLRRDEPLRILDLGCGHGRLGEFLAGRWTAGLDYVGIDSSDSLLESARARLAATAHEPLDGRAQFFAADLISEPPASALAGSSPAAFDLCCVFGLLHHIPGNAQRRALVESVAELVEPGGILALSFWQFDAHERFRRRFREDNAAVRPAGLNIAALDEGDHLVAWGNDDAMRYCHAASAFEIDDHIADLDSLGLALTADFESDGTEGSLNRYVLLQRPAGMAA